MFNKFGQIFSVTNFSAFCFQTHENTAVWTIFHKHVVLHCVYFSLHNWWLAFQIGPINSTLFLPKDDKKHKRKWITLAINKRMTTVLNGPISACTRPYKLRTNLSSVVFTLGALGPRAQVRVV